LARKMENAELAPEERRRGRLSIITTAVIGVLLFYSMMQSVQVLFANKIGASASAIGFIYSIYFIFSLFQVFTARWIQAHGKKRFLLPGYFIASATPIILIFVPNVYEGWGTPAAVAVMAVTYVVYALAGHTAVSAWFPLIYDNVEEDKRGKFFGVMRTCWQFSSLAYLIFVAFFLGREATFNRFRVVFAVGAVAGMMRILLIRRASERLPNKEVARMPIFSGIAMPFRDKGFRTILVYIFVFTFGHRMLYSFFPYMTKNWLGFQDRFSVLFCEVGFLAGSILSVFLWGYLSDRFGSKPIYFVCNAGMIVVFLLWIFIGPDSSYVYFLLGIIVVFSGVFLAGFNLAYIRNVMGVMPADHSAIFLSATSICIYLATGMGPIAAGQIIEHLRHVSFAGGYFNQYKLLVLISVAVMSAGLILGRRIREEGSAPTKEFLGFFFSWPLRFRAILFLYLKAIYDKATSSESRYNSK